MKIANINMQEGAGESCCKSNRQFSYFRLPLRIQMYATFFSILFATLGLVSCSTPSRNLSFSNSNEAIEECRAFLKELKEKDKPEIIHFRHEILGAVERLGHLLHPKRYSSKAPLFSNELF